VLSIDLPIGPPYEGDQAGQRATEANRGLGRLASDGHSVCVQSGELADSQRAARTAKPSRHGGVVVGGAVRPRSLKPTIRYRDLSQTIGTNLLAKAAGPRRRDGCGLLPDAGASNSSIGDVIDERCGKVPLQGNDVAFPRGVAKGVGDDRR